jgi:hypothetical protein
MESLTILVTFTFTLEFLASTLENTLYLKEEKLRDAFNMFDKVRCSIIVG